MTFSNIIVEFSWAIFSLVPLLWDHCVKPQTIMVEGFCIL